MFVSFSDFPKISARSLEGVVMRQDEARAPGVAAT